MSIRIGIFGYGNLGRGVESAIKQNKDMELVAVFTRRPPESLKINTAGVPVYHADTIEQFKDKIDCLIICGGSATDLPVQTPALAKSFNVIDSFDTHARIPEHFNNVDASAKEACKVAVISCGKDNSYGHPHKEVLSNLEKLNYNVYRTDLHGMIIVTSNRIKTRFDV